MSNTFWLSYALLWVMVVAESLLLFALLRELGRIYLRQSQSISRDGLSVGSVLPEIDVETPRGQTVLPSLLVTPYTLIVCALPDCPLCGPVVEAGVRWAHHRSQIGALVLLSGPASEHSFDSDNVEVAIADSDEVLQRLEVRASPFVFVVSRRGEVLAKGLANGRRDVRRLLADAGAFELANAKEEEEVVLREEEPAVVHAQSR
jgi:hypothetical protein